MIVTYNPVVTGTVAEPENLQDYPRNILTISFLLRLTGTNLCSEKDLVSRLESLRSAIIFHEKHLCEINAVQCCRPIEIGFQNFSLV